MSGVSNGTLPLETLRKWLGERAILLPLPFGEKKPVWPDWQSTTFERTQESDYQEKLKAAIDRGGNIGVLLVEGLAAIDIDDDQLVEPFLALNPALTETLRSKGARGCQLWLRMDGDYPRRIHKLKKINGPTFGEWRGGGGAQSVIAGRHPSGCQYLRLVKGPAVRIAFTDIKWPTDIVPPWEKNVPPPKTTRPSDLDKRITAYLAEIPRAISGENGHRQTFSVAVSSLTDGD